MMNEKVKLTLSIISILALLIPSVGAAYILRNNGTILIDNGSLYVNGLTIDNYIISVVGGGGAGNQTFQDTVTCVIDDSAYVAYLQNGTVLYSGASPFTCLQTALDFTTHNGAGVVTYRKARVYNNTSVFVGPGYWDIGANDLDVPNKVHLRGAGRDATIIKGSLANAVIQNMWSNYTFAVEISDMRVQNSANACNVIKWTSTSSGLPSGETYGGGMLSLSKLNLRYTGSGTYNLYASSTTGDHTRITITDIKGSGTLYLNRIFDSYFTGMFINKIKLVSGSSSNHFSDSYIGGGLDYGLEVSGDTSQWSCYANIFTNCRFDNPTRNFVNLGGYAQGFLFSGCTFSNLNWNTADNTWDGIVLGANTHHTTIVGCRFANDLESNDAATLRYVIYETAGTHSNIYLGNSYESNIYSSIPLYETGLIYSTQASTPWETAYGTRRGVAEASNDDWVAHGMPTALNVGANNCTVVITIQESDAPYAWGCKAVNATHFQLYLYDIAAAGAEVVDKTVAWVAYYLP